MNTISERFDRGAKANSTDAAKIAKKIGISKQFVSDIVTGKTPGKKHIGKISETLGCTVEWLVNGTGEVPSWWPASDNLIHASRVQEPAAPYVVELETPRQIPVIGHAGASNNGHRGLLADHPEIKTLPPNTALIAVRGGSAYPAIYDGQWAMVSLNRKVRSNNVVAAVLRDTGEVVVKRWCPQPDGEHVVLASLDGGRDSLAFHTHDILHCWPVVGVLYE